VPFFQTIEPDTVSQIVRLHIVSSKLSSCVQ